MPNNNTIDMNEIASTLRDASDNYDKLTAKEMDIYDCLIGKIISIEKLHKYSSSGEINKISDIERELENFLNNEE